MIDGWGGGKPNEDQTTQTLVLQQKAGLVFLSTGEDEDDDVVRDGVVVAR